MNSKLILALLIFTMVYGCSDNRDQKSAAVTQEPLVVNCSEPLPEFTLGKQSQPSENELKKLCFCVWGELGRWEKKVSQAISEGRENDITTIQKRAFPNRFGSAMNSCGAMDL